MLCIPHTDVEKAEEKANTNDANQKAKAVLREWRQREGKHATQEAILNALKECQLIDAMETLQTKWSQSKIERGKFKSQFDDYTLMTAYKFFNSEIFI